MSMARRLRPWIALALVASPGLALLAPARGADPVVPDYEFYKANVAPVVERVCAECHANPRKRLGKHFLRPQPGRTVRESHHRANYETILSLLEPGNPAASLWLLKPLGPGQGGVTHKGGVKVSFNSREYGAMVDFIQGRKLEQREFRPPPTVAGQPDFAFFHARIAPTLAQVCAECHSGKGQGRMVLRTAARGSRLSLEDHYANFQTVVALSTPGKPMSSRFLLKPLAKAEGGIAHKGGDRIHKGDANHVNWLAFLNGEVGPPIQRESGRDGPPLLEAALTIEAEDMERDAGLEERSEPIAPEKKWVVGATKSGRVWQAVRAPEPGDYAVSLAVRGGKGPLGFGLDDRPPTYVEVPESGTAEVGPSFLLDGKSALQAARGDLTLDEGRLKMDGRGAEAAFLSPAEKDHTGVEAVFRLAPEEDGGDDALLLFDMLDESNGKVAGLVDGGRRFVMGLMEGGTLRLLASAKTFPAAPGAPGRKVRVDYFEGVAVGRLDGQPLAFLHLDRHLGQGRFGALAHGAVEVEALEAVEQFPVHSVKFAVGPILHVPAGVHTLWVELPQGGAALDRLVLTLQDE
jgi:hypothetical protein